MVQTELFKRPRLTVMVLLLGNAALAAPVLLNAIRVVTQPEGEWAQLTRLLSPYLAVLMLLFALTIIGTLAGYARARNWMIFLLSILAGMMIWESSAMVCTVVCITNDIHKIPSADYWNISIGLRASVWLVINVWYFYVRGSSTSSVLE
jgi:hypothetical protein